MICVCLNGPSLEACRGWFDRVQMAEIRIDGLRATPDQVGELFGGHSNLVATCRADGSRSDDERLALVEAAIRGGAAWVDVELEADPAYRAALAERASASGCRVIVSHHDFDATPDLATLIALRDRCFAAGADLAKIACAVQTPRDNARLLGLLDDTAPVVVVGMGPLGVITRVAAPLLGAPFTFASPEMGRETAPGQLDLETLARLLEDLGEPLP
jgi:3-dehydroquinate dehydratase-1